MLKGLIVELDGLHIGSDRTERLNTINGGFLFPPWTLLHDDPIILLTHLQADVVEVPPELHLLLRLKLLWPMDHLPRIKATALRIRIRL